MNLHLWWILFSLSSLACVPDTARVVNPLVLYPFTDPDCLTGHYDSGVPVALLVHDSGSVLCHDEGTTTANGNIKNFRGVT